VSGAAVPFRLDLGGVVIPNFCYLTAVIGAGVVSAASVERSATSSDPGVALNFDVGKEWWVGDTSGLGIAARFYYSSTSMATALVQSEQSTVMFGIVMSATMQ
jgi:hypothetical protein